MAFVCKMILQCDLKPLTKAVLYLEAHMFVSGPATDTGHVAARVATDGEFPSFVFLGWIRPGVSLSQSDRDGGGLPAGKEPIGGLRAHSMKNSTVVFSESLESYLLGNGWDGYHIMNSDP